MLRCVSVILAWTQWWWCLRFREGECARSEDEEDEDEEDDSEGELLPERELDEDENDEPESEDAEEENDDDDNDDEYVDEPDDDPDDEDPDDDPDEEPCSLSSFFCSSFFFVRSCAFFTDFLSFFSIFRMFFRYSSNSARSCCASTVLFAPSFTPAGSSSKNSLVFSFIAFSSLCVREGRERYTPSLVHWYVQCPYWKHFWQYGSAFSIQSLFQQDTKKDSSFLLTRLKFCRKEEETLGTLCNQQFI